MQIVARDTLLAGRYRMGTRIATGGMGTVWRARDEVLGRSVAVKLLNGQYADDPGFQARFRAEACHTAGLSHPNIVSVFDYGEQTTADGSDHVAYLVMELVESTPLSVLLAQRGSLGVAETLGVLAQTADALGAAHAAGLVHRDVKPANLLVRADGVVKLTDFGIAWAASAVSLTSSGLVLGSASYLSPEQAAGRTVTAASDLYSLGLVGYECLTGHRPFSGDNPVAVATARLQQPPAPLPRWLPEPVRQLIDRCLAHEPTQRPHSAAELADQARGVRAELGVRTARLSVSGLEPMASRTQPLTIDATVEQPGGAGATARLLVPPPVAEARRRYRRSWWYAALGAAALVAVALVWWPSSATVAVPNVRGKQLSVAQTDLSHAHLDAVVRRVDAPPDPAGLVLAQDPAPGQGVHLGSVVSLTVTSGLVLVDQASYLGESYSSVVAALHALGLQVATSDTGTGAPAGNVTGLRPSGQVPAGSTVTVIVVPTATAPPVLPSPVPTGHSTHPGKHGPGHGQH